MQHVVYSSPFVPAEWIAAHGLRPERLVPRGDGGSLRLGVLTGVCPYARAFIGACLSERGAAGIVVTTTCDQMRRAPDLMAAQCEAPVFLMHVPATWQTAGAQHLYHDELQRLGRFLERIGGTAPDTGRLVEVMLEADAARRAIEAARPSMTARRWAEAMASSSFKVRADTNGQDASARNGATRLALVAGPLLREDFAIYDLVEDAGGTIVLDATEHGERSVPARFDGRRLRDDPLGELADAYFGTMRDAFRRPNDKLFAWLGRELVERDVQGVIYHSYVWCDTWEAEAHRLKESSPVPVLRLSTGNGDGDGLKRIAGQVQAFLEVAQ